MGRDARNPGKFANTIQTCTYGCVRSSPGFRWKNVGVPYDFRLPLDYIERCRTKCVHLVSGKLTNPPATLTQALCIACASSRR